jgi:hypothetical protein
MNKTLYAFHVNKTNLNKNNVKNSLEFVKKLENVELRNNELLVSFDVVGLFPNIILEAAFEEMKDFLESTSLDQNEKHCLMTLTEICMTQTTFQFRGNNYKQKSGTAIGNSASPMVADFFMNRFENEVKNESWFPRVWLRYVDDVFAIVEENKLDEI